jgi:hypothetical protein
MLVLPRKYVTMVAKSWGRAVSGPVLGVVGLILLAIQQTIHEASLAEKAVRWSAWITLGTAALMIMVSQYEVWKEEHESRTKCETALNAAADLRGLIRGLVLERKSI